MGVKELAERLNAINKLVSCALDNESQEHWMEASKLAEQLGKELLEVYLVVDFSPERQKYIVF